VAVLALLAGCAAPAVPPPAAQPEPPMAPPPPAPLSNTPEEVAFRAEASAARDHGLPILIQRRSWLGDRFNVAFYNVSGREIQDINFELVPYDSTGRVAGPRRSVRFVGPVRLSDSLQYGQREGTQEDVWNLPGISCIEISGLDLTYANGERRRYSFNAVTRMYREGVEKWCRFAF